MDWSELILPSGWIGLVCGVFSPRNKEADSQDKQRSQKETPQQLQNRSGSIVDGPNVRNAGFRSCVRVLPPDAYLPDLSLACDVVVGKLGYGTCSEVLAAGTPFVIVRRPGFCEEHTCI